MSLNILDYLNEDPSDKANNSIPKDQNNDSNAPSDESKSEGSVTLGDLADAITAPSERYESSTVTAAKEQATTGWKVDADIVKKYGDIGINYNPWENIEGQLADQQSFFSKAFNSVAQAVVSEAGLGTLIAFSDMIDYAGQLMGVSDHDYSNPVTQFLEQKQEEFREWTAIHRDESKTILNGGMLDSGWWFSQLPSVMSSLTLMLPAKALTSVPKFILGTNKLSNTRRALRSISGAERRLREGRQLSDFQRTILKPSNLAKAGTLAEVGFNGVTMRVLENYQEARQTYNSLLPEATEEIKSWMNGDDPDGQAKLNNFINKNQQLLKDENGQYKVDINNPTEIAKAVAAASADKTFAMDFANTVFDIVQMYALRNMWKGTRTAPSSASIRRERLNIAERIGRTTEQIAEQEAKKGFLSKARTKIVDFAVGSKLAVAAEFSEGIEEAINYIAQQEGLSMGRTMLGKDNGRIDYGFFNNLASIFDPRLSKYANAGELWDSAFFGVLGGVLFQGMGSKFNAIKNHIENKFDENASIKEKLPWWKAEDSETRARKAGLKDVEIAFNDYINKIKTINDKKKNPFQQDNQGKPKDIVTDTEREAAIRQAEDELATKIAFRNLNNGNFDELLALLEDDNLRQGFVQSGVAEEATSKDQMQRFINKVKEVSNQYDEELIALDRHAAELNDNNIPVEYLQIIATDNVTYKQKNQTLERENKELDARIAEVRNQLIQDGKLDESIDHERNITLGAQIVQLGNLYAAKRKLEAEPDSLSKKYSLDNINKRIRQLEDGAIMHTDAEHHYMKWMALRFMYDENGNIIERDNEESIKYRTEAIDKLITDKAEFGRFQALEQDATRTFATIKNISEELNNLYWTKAVNDCNIETNKVNLVKTKDELREEISMLHNTMNEARKQQIEKSISIIKKYYNKLDDFRERLLAYLNGNKTAFAVLPAEDRRELEDAIDVLKLSETWNRPLVSTLEAIFDLEDAINASKRETSVSSENQESEGESEESINVSNEEEKADSEEENGQNGTTRQSQQQAEPKRLSTKLVIEQSGKRKTLTNRKVTTFGTNEVDMYVYDRENIELDVHDNINYLGGEMATYLFDNAGELDLTRGVTVVERPIARYNNKNKLEIVTKGKLAYVDGLAGEETAEEIQRKAQEEQERLRREQEQKDREEQERLAREAEERAKEEASRVANQDDTEGISSTGVLESNDTQSATPEPTNANDTATANGTNEQQSEKPKDDTPINQEKPKKPTPPNEVVPEYEEPRIEKLKDATLGELHRRAKGSGRELDSFKEELSIWLRDQNIDNDSVEICVNHAIDTLNRVKARRLAQKQAEADGSKLKETVQSSVLEVVYTQSQIQELTKDTAEVIAYKQAVNNMLATYVQEQELTEVEGKVYINLEDLLRYINKTTNDSSMAAIIFDTLKQYLNTDEAKKDYIITDLKEANKANFIEKVSIDASIRNAQKFTEIDSQRVDLVSFVEETTDPKALNDFYEAVEELNQGDKLDVKLIGHRLYLYDKKNRPVGTMTKPKVNSSTGAYELPVAGFNTDVLNGGNGISSIFIDDYLRRWLTSTDAVCTNLRNIIIQLAYNPNVNKQQLYQQFESNAEIQACAARNIIDSNSTTEQRIDGLIHILKFALPSSYNVNSKLHSLVINQALDDWKDKLYHTYEGLDQIKSVSNLAITIEEISDGEVIRLTDDDPNSNPAAIALPIHDALANGGDPNVNKLVGVHSGQILMSGETPVSDDRFKTGSTYVTIPNRNGDLEYVNAYPIGVDDSNIGQDAKDIIQAIFTEYERLIEEYQLSSMSADGSDTFDNLKTFIENLFSNSISSKLFSRNNIFYNSSNADSFTIAVKGTDNVLTFFRNSKNPSFRPNVSYKLNGTSGHARPKSTIDQFKSIVNNFAFNISFDYIKSDAEYNYPMQGVARKENGKFVIKIGDKEWSYDSYNEFVVNNNLVRLNTRPNSITGNTNFNVRPVRTQAATQVLRVNIQNTAAQSNSQVNTQQSQQSQQEPATSNISTPVEESTKQETPKNYATTAKHILNSDSSTKAIDLVRESNILSEDAINALANLNLLPDKIVFDPNFNSIPGNETFNAEVSFKNKLVTVGTRWVDLYNNRNSRFEAIRKLIHEKLHLEFHNTGYVKSAEGIYEEFKTYLNNDKSELATKLRVYLFEDFNNEEDKKRYIEYFKYRKTNPLSEEDAIKAAEDYIKIQQLEEFLIESLTSEELNRYLDSIPTTIDNNKRSNATLLGKLLDLLSKVFNWTVTEGNLLDKELKSLRATFKEDRVQDRKAKVDSAPIVEQIIKDGEQVHLTSDEKYYVDEATGQIYTRVTTAITADDENIGEDGQPHRFDPNSPWAIPSTNIGTGVDEFTRDFFLGKLDDMSEEDLEAAYPNATGYQWASFRDQLIEFRDSLQNGTTVKGKHITIVSRDIKANGTVDVKMPNGAIKQLNVNGTLDLLGYDEEGNFYVFDMKTVHSDSYINDSDKNAKWNRQLQLYKQFIEGKYNVKVAGCFIIPIKVNYDTPVGATNKKGESLGGTATYTVQNPDAHLDYDNPNRTQLLINGAPFKDAQPDLKPILAKSPHKGSIQYDNLDDNAKALLDGTVTYDTYNNQNNNITSAKDDILTGEEVENIISDLQTIPYDSVRWNDKTNQKEYFSGESKFIDCADRIVCVVDINGFKMPFYISTGLGGKTDVATGKWYPFFGMGTDGWFNKTKGSDINNYYGSEILRQISEALDKKYGDLRGKVNAPKVKLNGKHADFINQNLNPTENGTANTRKNLDANISATNDNIKKAVSELHNTTQIDSSNRAVDDIVLPSETPIIEEQPSAFDADSVIDDNANVFVDDSEEEDDDPFGDEDRYGTGGHSSVTESTSYSEEMQSIKDKAIADGTFMKAPNGRPTNLTERQWLQVRTKAFKDWFGDWESVNNFALDNIDTSKVEIELVDKPWKNDASKVNKTVRIYLKRQREKGYFELVKDQEPFMYSVHFKTGDGNTGKTYGSTKEERAILYKELINALPKGAQISTWGEISKGGITALNKIGSSMTKVGERQVKDREGNNINIPIYQNGESNVSKVVDDNGEPLVVYHSTSKKHNANFEVFDVNIEGKLTAIYASSNIKVSQSYIEDNYIDMIDDDFVRSELRSIPMNKMEIAIKNSIRNMEDMIADDRKNTMYESILYAFKDALSLYYDYINADSNRTKALFYNIKNPKTIKGHGANWNQLRDDANIEDFQVKETTRTIEDKYRNSEYDGLIIKDIYDMGISGRTRTTSDIYAAYTPNQVKSASDNVGEFSLDDDNILHSSVTESSDEIVLATSSNIEMLKNSMPVSLREKFNNLVSNDVITSYCK